MGFWGFGISIFWYLVSIIGSGSIYDRHRRDVFRRVRRVVALHERLVVSLHRLRSHLVEICKGIQKGIRAVKCFILAIISFFLVLNSFEVGRIPIGPNTHPQQRAFFHHIVEKVVLRNLVRLISWFLGQRSI